MHIFSIIIPLFNRENLIAETLNSLQKQTFTKWEAIVVDDGSTDKSQNIVKEFAKNDSRIKLYIRDRQSKGAATCRNLAIQKAQGKYIIFLDSDDMLQPFALQQRYNTTIEKPSFDYWVFQTVNYQDNKAVAGDFWNKQTEEDNLTRFFKLDAVWHTSGPVWKTEVVKTHLLFDENLKCWQDVDFHIQALMQDLQYEVFFQLPADVLYRRHTMGSISQGSFNKEKRKSQFYFLKKYLKQKNTAEHRKILTKLYLKILRKNIESRYFFNALRMLFWFLSVGFWLLAFSF